MTGREPLTLASRSPRRQALLRAAGLAIDVCVSDVDESALRDGSPAQQALASARAKGLAIAADLPAGRLVLSADTMVVLDGEIFHKPTDDDDARRTLGRLAGRAHQVLTAICLGRADADKNLRPTAHAFVGGAVASPCGQWLEEVVAARVVFQPLDQDLVNRYVASGEPMDKAGAYGIQGLGARLVADVEGDVTCVVGLPMKRLGAFYEKLTGAPLLASGATLRQVALAAFPELAGLPPCCLRGLNGSADA